MRPLGARVRGLVMVAVLAVGSACTSGDGSPSPGSGARAASFPTATASSPRPSPGQAGSTTGGPHHRAVRAANLTVRRWLATWAADGPAAASRFLVPSQRATSDAGMPRLRAGRVTSVTLDSWRSAHEFVLEVSMDLRFDGSPMAWSRGANDRFVTVTRPTRGSRYLPELATSR